NFSLMMRCALAVGVGALPLVLWFLHYNEVTSGAAFKLSYQAFHGSGFNLGFGSRGFLGYDAAMNRVRIPVDFTPVVAIRHLLDMVLGVNLNFVAYAFLAPLVVVFALYGHRPNGRVLAAFLLLPLLHFFYWATGLRFYSEFLPLLLVWVAAGIFAVAQKNRALAARLTIAILVSNFVLAFPTRATSVTLASGWVRSAYFQSDGRLATFRTLENMSQARGKLLVFVSERIPRMDIMFDHLYQYNEQGLDSRILVVRDLGPRNKSLMARFPDRVPLMLRDRGRDGEASIQELTPAIAENIGEPSDATRVGSAR
ncbi:MAG: hypothetical protein ABIT38_10635, partial [Gemmatimonadaceae bacterium]